MSTRLDSAVSRELGGGASNNFGSVANLCSATLGAGVVSLPFAFQKCGLIGGMLLLSVAGIVTSYSIKLLAEAVSLCGDNGFSYEEMSHKLCGAKIGYLVEFSVVSFCFGVCVAYIVAVGDMLEDGVIKVFDDSLPGFVTRESAMFVFWLLLMLPLSCLKRIDSLKFSSVLGVISVSFLVFVTIFKSIESLSSKDDESDWFDDVALWPDTFSDFIQACPVIMFAFSCQVNVPQIYNELGENRSVTSLMWAARKAVSVCFMFYLLMGVMGYLNFAGKRTDANILKNYCVQDTHDPLVISAFACLSLAIVVSFPLNVFPCRASLLNRWSQSKFETTGSNDYKTPLLNDTDEDIRTVTTESELSLENLGNNHHKKITEGVTLLLTDDSEADSSKGAMHYFLTLFISTLALLVALIVPDISVVFGLIGGTAAALLGFVMPPIFAIQLQLTRNDESKKYLAWSLIVGGFITGCLSTSVTVFQLLHPSDSEAICKS